VNIRRNRSRGEHWLTNPLPHQHLRLQAAAPEEKHREDQGIT
jgi:hypothetical protein